MPDSNRARTPDPTRPANSGHITLIPFPDGWAADYTHTDLAESFIDLFGSAVIPLPFTSAAEAPAVAAHMRHAEPFVEIR